MGRQSITLWAEKEYQPYLHGVVDEVMEVTSAQAATRENIISNDVEAEIPILADSRKVSHLLNICT